MIPFVVPLYLTPAAGSSDVQSHEFEGEAAILDITLYFRHEKDLVNVSLQLLNDGVYTDITTSAIKGHDETYKMPLGIATIPKTVLVVTAENSDNIAHAVNVLITGMR